jgi:hypothetical protein
MVRGHGKPVGNPPLERGDEALFGGHYASVFSISVFELPTTILFGDIPSKLYPYKR